MNHNLVNEMKMYNISSQDILAFVLSYQTHDAMRYILHYIPYEYKESVFFSPRIGNLPLGFAAPTNNLLDVSNGHWNVKITGGFKHSYNQQCPCTMLFLRIFRF